MSEPRTFRNWKWWVTPCVCVNVEYLREGWPPGERPAETDQKVAAVLRRLADQLDDPQPIAPDAWEGAPLGRKDRQPGMSTLPKAEDLWQLREDAQPQEGSLSQERKPSPYRYPPEIKKEEFGVAVGPSAIYAWRHQWKRQRLHRGSKGKESSPVRQVAVGVAAEPEGARPESAQLVPSRKSWIPPEVKARARELDDQKVKPAKIANHIKAEFGLELNIGTFYNWKKLWKRARRGGDKVVVRPKQDGAVEVIRPPKKAPADLSTARNQMDRVYAFAKGRLLNGQSPRQVVDAIREKFNVTVPEDKIAHYRSQLKTPGRSVS